MKKIIQLFIYLTMLLIILELSVIGLCFNPSPLYLIPIFISTIGISLVSYGLYGLMHNREYQIVPKEYHFYYVDNNFYEDKLYQQLRKRA